MTIRSRSGSGQLPWWFGVPFALGGILVVLFGFVLLLDELRFGSDAPAVALPVPDRSQDGQLTSDELSALDARLAPSPSEPTGEGSTG